MCNLSIWLHIYANTSFTIHQDFVLNLIENNSWVEKFIKNKGYIILEKKYINKHRNGRITS